MPYLPTCRYLRNEAPVSQTWTQQIYLASLAKQTARDAGSERRKAVCWSVLDADPEAYDFPTREERLQVSSKVTTYRYKCKWTIIVQCGSVYECVLLESCALMLFGCNSIMGGASCFRL